MAENILLSARHLSKEYESPGGDKNRKLKAVSDVSFDIYKGECLALVGESGCGKSTLAKTLMSLHKASAGELFFEDKNIFAAQKKDKMYLKRCLQMVFQDPYASLNPRMNVFETLAEPIKAHKLCKTKGELNERVYSLMDVVGIPKEFAKRHPHQFSGGQRQRIGIARALTLDPKLMVLDEPVSALDVSIQAQILNLLKDIKEEKNLSYLFISHDLSVVRFISDRVMIMFLGRIMEIGDTDTVFAHPLHPYTKLLMDSVPKTDPGIGFDVKELNYADIPSPTELPTGCRFHTRCPYAKKECEEREPELKFDEKGNACACHFPL